MGLRVLFGKDFGARRHEKSMQLEVEHEQKTLKNVFKLLLKMVQNW